MQANKPKPNQNQTPSFVKTIHGPEFLEKEFLYKDIKPVKMNHNVVQPTHFYPPKGTFSIVSLATLI